MHRFLSHLNQTSWPQRDSASAGFEYTWIQGCRGHRGDRIDPGFDAVAPHLYPFKECPDPIQTFLSFTESNCQLFGTFQQLLACVVLTVYDCYIVKEQDKVLVEPAF